MSEEYIGKMEIETNEYTELHIKDFFLTQMDEFNVTIEFMVECPFEKLREIVDQIRKLDRSYDVMPYKTVEIDGERVSTGEPNYKHRTKITIEQWREKIEPTKEEK